AGDGIRDFHVTGVQTCALPILRGLLKDKDPEVRFTAAKALWQITEQAEASLPVLVETLASSDRQLRMQAFRVLTTDLGPAAAPTSEERRAGQPGTSRWPARAPD